MRIVNVKGTEAFGIIMNTQLSVLFQFTAPSEECRAPHVCLFLFICVGGWFFICDLNTSAGEHLNVLQIRVYVLRTVVCMRVFFRLLAGRMKYSWWHGGIGC